MTQTNNTPTHYESKNSFTKKEENKQKEYLELAEKYYDKMDLTNSIIEYQKAITIMPNSAEAYFGLGKAQWRQGVFNNKLYDKAKSNFRKAIKIKHDYAEVYYFLGERYYIDALGVLAFGNSGDVRFQDNINDAIFNTQRALNYKPNWDEAHFLLGKIYSHSNKMLALNEYNILKTSNKKLADLLLKRIN